MTRKQLQEYLESALNLEMIAYLQGKVVTKSADIKKTSEERIKKAVPQQPSSPRPFQEKEPRERYNSRKRFLGKGVAHDLFCFFAALAGGLMVLALFFGGCASACSHVMNDSADYTMPKYIAIAALCCLVPALLIAIWNAYQFKKEQKEVDAYNAAELAEYNKRKDKWQKEEKRKYTEGMAEYHEKMEVYNKKLSVYHSACDYLADDEVLHARGDKTLRLLAKLYAKNVIYPKYRDLIAVSSLYEYFETRRCTELDGPDGAYSLFETERRMKLIVERLGSDSEINPKNQYVLTKVIARADAVAEKTWKIIDNLFAAEDEQTLKAAEAALETYYLKGIDDGMESAEQYLATLTAEAQDIGQMKE